MYGINIALYDLESGFEKQGAESINDPKNVEKSAEFIKLKVQARFYAGRSNYREEELVQLKEWLKECGPQQMYDYFLGSVLTQVAS